LEQGLEDIENGILYELRQENLHLTTELTDLRADSLKTKQLQDRLETHKSTFNEVISQKDMQIEALTKSLTQQIA
jgi:arsenate reductase-like glutaredoxin family protein